MEKSIREIITEVSNELRDNLDMLEPIVISKKLIMLSSLFSSLNAHIAKFDAECRYKLNEIYKKQEKKSVAAAKVEMEALPEWREFNDAKLQAIALTGLIQSLKLFIRTNQLDWNNQKIQ